MSHELYTSSDVRGNDSFSRVELSTSPIQDVTEKLDAQVFGQHHVSELLAHAVVRRDAGFTDRKRPQATFFFLGQTGVGKTEMAKALARHLYGDEWEKHFLRIDCTELQDSVSYRRITGSDPSYVGYGDPTLIEEAFLQQEGGSVIVFDEVEKAHPNVHRTLLPILDEGELRIYASTGKESKTITGKKEVAPTTLHFDNTFIILTSNVGADALQRVRRGQHQFGFRTHEQTHADTREIAMSKLRESFVHMPELLGRIGEKNIAVFNELMPDEYHKIFNKYVGILREKIGSAFDIEVTQELKEIMIRIATGDGRYGARDIRTVVENMLETKVAEIKAANVLHEGAQLIADVEGEDVIFWTNTLNAPETAVFIQEIPVQDNSDVVVVSEQQFAQSTDDETKYQFGVRNNNNKRYKYKSRSRKKN